MQTPRIASRTFLDSQAEGEITLLKLIAIACTRVIDPLIACKSFFREEQHLVTLMSVMAACFMVTMIPSILIPFVYHDYETTDVGYRLFRALAAVTELCNFAVHVVIYLACSKQFREEFLKILQVKENEYAKRAGIEASGEY